jgi:hypothetical protein
MPNRFKSFDNSVPGPLVGGAGGSVNAAAVAGHARGEPQNKSNTPHFRHLPDAESHSQNEVSLKSIYCHLT